MDKNLAEILNFSFELDKLKQIKRQNITSGELRPETTAEHSWHLAMLVPLLAPYAKEPVDEYAAMIMASIHDVVEIEAGDTYAYDAPGHLGKFEREEQAAAKTFGLLPKDLNEKFSQSWHEFEAGQTPEARFVRALDRLQPLMLHRLTDFAVWRQKKVRLSQVLARVSEVKENMPALWPFIEETLDIACKKGAMIADVT